VKSVIFTQYLSGLYYFIPLMRIAPKFALSQLRDWGCPSGVVLDARLQWIDALCFDGVSQSFEV